MHVLAFHKTMRVIDPNIYFRRYTSWKIAKENYCPVPVFVILLTLLPYFQKILQKEIKFFNTFRL